MMPMNATVARETALADLTALLPRLPVPLLQALLQLVEALPPPLEATAAPDGPLSPPEQLIAQVLGVLHRFDPLPVSAQQIGMMLAVPNAAKVLYAMHTLGFVRQVGRGYYQARVTLGAPAPQRPRPHEERADAAP